MLRRLGQRTRWITPLPPPERHHSREVLKQGGIRGVKCKPSPPAALKHVVGEGVDNTLSTEPHSSIAVVFTLERAVNVDTNMNCMFQPLWDQLVNTAGHNQQRRNTSWPSTPKCFRKKPFSKFNRSGINTVIRDKPATHIQLEVGFLVRLKQINGSSTGYKQQRHTQCRKMQIRHFLLELCRQEVGIVFVGRGFLPRPLRIKLWQHMVRDGKHTAHGR